MFAVEVILRSLYERAAERIRLEVRTARVFQAKHVYRLRPPFNLASVEAQLNACNKCFGLSDAVRLNYQTTKL